MIDGVLLETKRWPAQWKRAGPIANWKLKGSQLGFTRTSIHTNPLSVDSNIECQHFRFTMVHNDRKEWS